MKVSQFNVFGIFLAVMVRSGARSPFILGVELKRIYADTAERGDWAM